MVNKTRIVLVTVCTILLRSANNDWKRYPDTSRDVQDPITRLAVSDRAKYPETGTTRLQS
jgi:hypothetical protein